MRPRSTFLLLFNLLLTGLTLAGETIRVKPISPPQLWQLAEFRVENGPSAANAFDPETVQLDATITSPSGQKSVIPAFWYQDFTRALVNGAEILTPTGPAEWRIRFTPTEHGEHLLSLGVKANGVPPPSEPIVTRFIVPSTSLPAQHGWVRNGPDRRFFETSDGKPLRLLGENVCWAERGGTFDFDAWFDSLEKSGQNFARLWCSPWWINLEHRPNTLTHYSLDSAWQLDRIFQLAEQHGIYLMLCFDHHGMFQMDNQNWGSSNNFWKTNPYNKLSGGPCENPNDFFTDSTAQALYRKRLRYLIARYSYSPHLLAWQFFNEIDNVYAPRQSINGPDVTAWHHVMGQWLHANDPFHHLVTSSLTGGSDRPELWNLAEMDFSMYHSYADPALGRWIAGVGADYPKRYGKPVMVGEFGVSAQSWALKTDPHLRGFRQALWSGALSGTVGSAMSWWWQDIHADNVYPLYSALSKILHTGGWQEGSWAPLSFPGSQSPPTDLESEKEGEAPFSAILALSAYRRSPTSCEVAVADPLSAERASEALSSYLHGTNNPTLKKPVKLSAFFGKDAKLVFRVNSVGSDLELIVQVDGKEVSRTRLFDRDGLAVVNREIDKEFSIPIPPGKHVIQITNTGVDWAYLDSLRLDGVQPSNFAGKWQWTPEVVGLRNPADRKAILYFYSQYIVFPAGASRYHPPALEQQTIALPNWPEGSFTAVWYNPETGEEVTRTTVSTASGVLTLSLPRLTEDLAVLVAPAK